MNNHSSLSIIINSILIFLILNVGFLNAQASNPKIKIHYLGHSSFVLSFDNGINIVTDYGKKNAWIDWGWDSPILDIGELIPDVMTFSHEHEDHYDPLRIPKGVKYILKEVDNLSIDEIEITPVRTCESDMNIESNTSFIFQYKGLKICHLGDAQAQIININDQQVKEKIINSIPQSLDLLFMTIDGTEHFIEQAADFIDILNPKRVIPMHYWSENYLQEFLSYLETHNNLEISYKIQEYDSAVYNLYVSEIVDSTKVISLERAFFSKTTNDEYFKRDMIINNKKEQ